MDNNDTEENGFLWGVLGFFFPLVGFILYFALKSSRPIGAKASGLGAGISLIVFLLFRMQ